MLQLRLALIEPTRPYHAALVRLRGGSPEGQLHTHADFAEVMLVLDGGGTHHVNGAVQTLEPLSVVVVRPGDHHVARPGPDGLEFINVAFPADVLASALRWGGDGVARAHRSTLPVVYVASAEASGRMHELFAACLTTYRDSPTVLAVIELLAYVLRNTPASVADGRVDAPEWLTRCLHGMASETRLREGLPAMLALARVSHTHLSRTMRQHLGRSPIDWLTETRLDHSASLLATTAIPVALIAERCGFGSSSYFGRCFRARFGVSPREFRRQQYRDVIGS